MAKNVEKKTAGKKMIRIISYVIVLAVGFGAGAWLAYEYLKGESTNHQVSQKLESQVSDLERQVRQLNATISELEDASEKKATDPGNLTFYSDLPTEEVSPEPLETGKAVKIGAAITPSTSVSHEAMAMHGANDKSSHDNLASALHELNQVKEHHSEDASGMENKHHFHKEIPAASDMNAEVASQAIPATTSQGRYRVQAGSFQNESDAKATQNKLSTQGVAAMIKRAQVNGNTWYRVQVGPYVSLSDAKTAKAQLQSIVKGNMLIVKSAR